MASSASRKSASREDAAALAPAAERGSAAGPYALLGTPGAGVEIAPGAPAEYRFGEQKAQPALEMAELLGGETAVAALHQMLLDIGQQGATAANGDVQQPVVETAFLARREFPVGVYAALPELLAGLLQSSRRGVGIHTRQTGWYGYVLGFDLGVPQQGLGERGQSVERALGELPVFGRHGLGRPHTATPGGFPQVRQHTGYPVLRGPRLDGVPHGHEKPGPQGDTGLAAHQTVEHLVEGGRGHHGGDVRRGSEADDRVVVRGLPVPGHQQGDRMGGLALRPASQLGSEALVGFAGSTAGRIRGTRGVGGVHRAGSFQGARRHTEVLHRRKGSS